MNPKTKAELAAMIDHTQLKAAATEADILKLCNEAVENSFASVCVNPVWVPFAFSKLNGTGVKVCTVIGFPLGANASYIKAEEAKHAVLQGAEEVDMVINVGFAKAHNYKAVQEDIEAVVKAAHDAERTQGYKALVKVIIETCDLTEDEKIRLCRIVSDAKADFIKTSTGFGSAGAKVEDIVLMKNNVDPEVRIKAAGGIRTEEAAKEMIANGADRIGASRLGN